MPPGMISAQPENAQPPIKAKKRYHLTYGLSTDLPLATVRRSGLYRGRNAI